MLGCHFRHTVPFLCALQDKTQETLGEQALVEMHPQELSNQDQDDSDSTSAAPTLDSTSPANMQL